MTTYSMRSFALRSILRAGFLAGAFALALLPAPRAAAQGGAQKDSSEILPNTFATLAERTLPSVVAVYVKVSMKEQMTDLREKMEPFKEFFDDPQWRRFFKEGPEGQTPGQKEEEDPHEDERANRTSGSGVIIRADGYIVTNNHIVERAQPGTVSVVLHDDTEIPAEKVKVVATDELLDLAVIKIDTTGLDLKPLPWGDSDKMRIGDWVLAIGNPLDLRGSVSKGIISAKTRKIGKAPIEHLIQTDAMINPGNSGGALINLEGELIGVNMAIATNSGFFQGIGFAIPSNDAKFITDQVIEDGRVRRGYIGIFMKPLEETRLQTALGLGPESDGILVQEVVPDAPAAKAGVEAYDIITKVDGRSVKDTGDLLGIIASKRVGDSAELTILRGAGAGGDLKEVGLKMQVTERPLDVGQMRQAPQWKRVEEKPKFDGMTLAPIKQDDKLGLEVTAVEQGSAAARAGIMPGDVIREVNRKAVGEPKDYADALAAAKEGAPSLVRLERDGRMEIVALQHKTEKPAEPAKEE